MYLFRRELRPDLQSTAKCLVCNAKAGIRTIRQVRWHLCGSLHISGDSIPDTVQKSDFQPLSFEAATSKTHWCIAPIGGVRKAALSRSGKSFRGDLSSPHLGERDLRSADLTIRLSCDPEIGCFLCMGGPEISIPPGVSKVSSIRTVVHGLGEH
jgi:hypothetical protein